MSWQAVGSPQSFTYVAKDIEGDENHSFTFNGNEGNVKIHYRIHSKKRPGSNVRVRVQFDELEVIDDEEIGSGDWRIRTSVNNINCANSPEEHWSIGSGSSADLAAFRSVTVPVNSTLIIRCRVQEEDS